MALSRIDITLVFALEPQKNFHMFFFLSPFSLLSFSPALALSCPLSPFLSMYLCLER